MNSRNEARNYLISEMLNITNSIPKIDLPIDSNNMNTSLDDLNKKFTSYKENVSKHLAQADHLIKFTYAISNNDLNKEAFNEILKKVPSKEACEYLFCYIKDEPKYVLEVLSKLNGTNIGTNYLIEELLRKIFVFGNKTILNIMVDNNIFDQIIFSNKDKYKILLSLINEKGIDNIDTVKYIASVLPNLLLEIPTETRRKIADQSDEHKRVMLFESNLSNEAYEILYQVDYPLLKNLIHYFHLLANNKLTQEQYIGHKNVVSELLALWDTIKVNISQSQIKDEIEKQIMSVISKKQDELEAVSGQIEGFKKEGKKGEVSYYQTIGGILGRYNKQEDAFSIFVESESTYKNITAEKWKKSLKRAYSMMQESFGVENEGSTAITTMLLPKNNVVTIITATVGDSASYLVRIEKDNNVKCERISPLHNPKNESEKARISTIPGAEITAGRSGERLGGTLAVTRAIGDNSILGLSHEPEIMTKEIALVEGDRLFVVSTCDGLTEKAKSGRDEDYLKMMVEQLCKNGTIISADTLPEKLAKQAIQDGSTDNITVLAMQLTPEMRSVTSLSVFDGHAGNNVSSAMGQHFSSTLRNLCNDEGIVRSFEKIRRILISNMIVNKIQQRVKAKPELLNNNLQVAINTYNKAVMTYRLTDLDIGNKDIKSYINNLYEATKDNNFNKLDEDTMAIKNAIDAYCSQPEDKDHQNLDKLCANVMEAIGLDMRQDRLKTIHIKVLTNDAFIESLRLMESRLTEKLNGLTQSNQTKENGDSFIAQISKNLISLFSNSSGSKTEGEDKSTSGEKPFNNPRRKQ